MFRKYFITKWHWPSQKEIKIKNPPCESYLTFILKDVFLTHLRRLNLQIHLNFLLYILNRGGEEDDSEEKLPAPHTKVKEPFLTLWRLISQENFTVSSHFFIGPLWFFSSRTSSMEMTFMNFKRIGNSKRWYYNHEPTRPSNRFQFYIYYICS